ncbi:MAG: hypothetical protein IPL86_15550, partial [Flavobacteriales bacterium]|nr:hypothetical protein [Flavobacteriales bacterium]
MLIAPHGAPMPSHRQMGAQWASSSPVAQDGDLPGAVAKAQAACITTIHILHQLASTCTLTRSAGTPTVYPSGPHQPYFASIGVKVEIRRSALQTPWWTNRLLSLVGLLLSNDPRVVRDMQRT